MKRRGAPASFPGEGVEIGIVGFGRFGRFAAEILGKDFPVSVFDRKPLSGQSGVRFAALREVARKPCLLLCVPISRMELVCRRLGPLLTPGQLVMDTCSVKEEPLRLMLDLFPESVDVLGTHPLFGPETGRHGIAGLDVVLCPGRGDRTGKVEQYLKELGLKVTVTSATEHDRAMARTQALFHFLAQGFSRMKVGRDTLATPGPAQLFRAFQDVRGDSRQLFRDLQQVNRFAPAQRKKLIDSLAALDRSLSRRRD
ncbi:MAG: prephenate dehydrogenase [Acidobacteria bacterium]|nr:prephenate dehydrogenase [Acidobacteriota bacterium]